MRTEQHETKASAREDLVDFLNAEWSPRHNATIDTGQRNKPWPLSNITDAATIDTNLERAEREMLEYFLQ